jgi:hypothetical protein
MESKELRIGNYFQWSELASMGKGIDQITHGQQISDYISFKEGLPLTEDRIQLLGYKRFGKDWALHGVIIHTRKRGYVLNKKVPILKYVHQLQNLHYALTGKEI